MSARYYDPTDRRNKWRWDLASLVNRLPYTCWSNLVDWALGSGRLVDLSGNQDDVRQTFTCHKDAFENGTCYCGKVARP